MSDQMSDADKIRSKRLAKLGNQTPSSASGDASSTSTAAPGAPTTGETVETKLSQPSRTPSQPQKSPLSALGAKQTPDISIRPSSSTPAKREAEATPQSRQPKHREPPEEWEHRTLSNLFRITLDPERLKDIHQNDLYFVGGVRGDLEAGGKLIRLNTSQEVLEQAIVEAASNQGKVKPLEYLLGCWKRIIRLSRSLKTGPVDETKTEVIKEARRLCISYCIFAVTVPGLFGLDEEPTNGFVLHLLADSECDVGLDFEFLQEAVNRFEDDPSIKEALVQAVEQISNKLSGLTMNDSYVQHVRVRGCLRTTSCKCTNSCNSRLYRAYFVSPF